MALFSQVSPTAGKLDLLRDILQHSVYPTSSGTGTLHTLDMLLSSVPASRAEIVSALNRAGAVEVDGALRTICSKARAETLRALMQTAVAQGWELDGRQVQEGECLAALEAALLPADPVVLQAVLRSLCAADPHSAGAGGDGVVRYSASPRSWQLDQRKVRTATARLLLSQPPTGSGPAAWALQDFLLEWGLVTPGLRSAGREDLALLRGVAVATDGGQLVPLPVEAMAGLDVKVSTQLHCLLVMRCLCGLIKVYVYLAGATCRPLRAARALRVGGAGAVPG
jgi:hypothetical protein